MALNQRATRLTSARLLCAACFSFATLIINKLILANASASINKLEQAVFGPGMIPPEHRARQYDAWYPRNKVWCIEAGAAQPIEYNDSKYG